MNRPHAAFSVGKLAELAGLSAYAIYQLHPEDFGSPGHYQMRASSPWYTDKGVRALVPVLEARGMAEAARKFEALLAEFAAGETGASSAAGEATPLTHATASSPRSGWAHDWEEAHQ